MEGHISRIALLNLPVAGDIDTTNMPGWARITGLIPMPTSDDITVTEIVAAAEVRQEVTLNAASAITASTKYQIVGRAGTLRYEGAGTKSRPYGYTSPAVLTGTAAIDEHNAYVSIAYKINHDYAMNATAYPLITVAQTNATPFAENEIVTETASGAIGINLKTVAGAAAGTTGTLTIGVISGTWSGIATGTSTAGTLTGSLGGASTSTTHVTVPGIGLRIKDKAGYYDIEGINGGASSWNVTQGFAASDLVTTTAAVYSEGQGAELITRLYRTDRGSGNRASGQYGFAINEVPVAGRAYSRFEIVWRPKSAANALSDQMGTQENRQTIYMDNAAAGFAATRTAILAL